MRRDRGARRRVSCSAAVLDPWRGLSFGSPGHLSG